jgi:hypothetical protein
MAGPDPPVQPQPEKDPLADDPFFKLPDDSDWNACIGKQGNELNYLDGYCQQLDVSNSIYFPNVVKRWQSRDLVDDGGWT